MIDNSKTRLPVMPGTDVNFVDAVAYLSRVNYGSVMRVLASLHAIADHTGNEAGALVDWGAMPAEVLDPAREEHKQRARNTHDLVSAIVHSGEHLKYGHLIANDYRFKTAR